MKPEHFVRRLLLVGAVALLLYVVLFAGIEHQRNRRGPWEVVFTRTTNDLPCLEIHQPRLGVRGVRIVFPADAANPAATLPAREVFREARPTPFDLPLGRCVFLDTISLPGTVAIELGGHQVQLMPRVLTVDGEERTWRSGETIAVAAKNPTGQPTP